MYKGDGKFLLGYVLWMGISVVAVLIGSYLSIYVDPASSGSGITDVKCFLNGIKNPSLMKYKTIYIKMIGCVFGYAAGLAGGKVGNIFNTNSLLLFFFKS